MPQLKYLYLNSEFFGTRLFVTRMTDKKLGKFFYLQFESFSFFMKPKEK